MFNTKDKKPFGENLVGLLFMPGFCVIIYIISIINNKTDDNQGFFMIGMCTAVMGCIYLYKLILVDRYDIDMTKCIILKQRHLMKFILGQSIIQWNKESCYLYEIKFDLYKKITAVWFIAFHKDTKEKNRLVKFYDIESFEAFKKHSMQNTPTSLLESGTIKF